MIVLTILLLYSRQCRRQNLVMNVINLGFGLGARLDVQDHHQDQDRPAMILHLVMVLQGSCVHLAIPRLINQDQQIGCLRLRY